MVLALGCGGNQTSGPTGTPVGTYQVSIVGTAGTLQHTATVTLQVK
jgi:hypothetical protein